MNSRVEKEKLVDFLRREEMAARKNQTVNKNDCKIIIINNFL